MYYLENSYLNKDTCFSNPSGFENVVRSSTIQSDMAFGTRGTYPKVNTLPQTIAGAPTQLGFRYCSFKLAPNGFLYSFPYSITGRWIKLNPFNDTFQEFSTGAGNSTFQGLVLAENGRLYAVPGEHTAVIELNPETDTLSSFGTLPGGPGTGNKYGGGVLATNGLIYCAPYFGTNILIINPYNRTTSTIGSFTSGGSKWHGGCLAPNGKIYFFPYSNIDSILVVDPLNNNRIYQIGPISTLTSYTFLPSLPYVGGVLALDDYIYLCGYNNGCLLKIDWRNDTLSIVPNVGINDLNRRQYNTNRNTPYSFVAGYGWPVMATNGKVYSTNLAYNSTSRALYNSAPFEFDPYYKKYSNLLNSIDTSNYSITTDGTPSALWMSGGVSINGDIYFAPRSSQRILKISGFPPMTPDMYRFPGLSNLKDSLWNKYMNRGI